jgi:flavin reductase (DIM6/NTAB) family NADH-FMN oxidoreductase RutF
MMAVQDWVTPEDPVDLRQALGCFATGITIITGVTAGGARFGLTASSFQPVSLKPPLVLYSIRKGAASIGLVKSSGYFCVNVLRHEHAELAKRFAAPVADRFEGLEWYSGCLGCPVLPDAIASFECRLWTTYDGGDHEIVVGEVAKLRRARDGNPLVYFRGEFHPIVSGSSRSA